MKKYLIKYFVLVTASIFSLLAVSSCNYSSEPKKPIYIAISHSVPKYIDWLKSANPEIIGIDFYILSKDSIDLMFNKCQALLLTGGTDIYPGRYGMEQDTLLCEIPDLRRDTLEFLLLQKAIEQKKPVFGICRGLQLINVALGGTLYTDLPKYIGNKVTHRNNGNSDCFHNVLLSKPSLLYDAAEADIVKVNSYHHQGIRKLASGLTTLAVSDDYLIEAIQWTDTTNNNIFIVGVQFHPEMLPKEDKFSQRICRSFISAIEKKISKEL